MIIQVQPNFPCENCIKCGKRPQVEAHKRGWTIACPDKKCKNEVNGKIADFATWNRLNKKPVEIITEQGHKALKRTA